MRAIHDTIRVVQENDGWLATCRSYGVKGETARIAAAKMLDHIELHGWGTTSYDVVIGHYERRFVKDGTLAV